MVSAVVFGVVEVGVGLVDEVGCGRVWLWHGGGDADADGEDSFVCCGVGDG